MTLLFMTHKNTVVNKDVCTYIFEMFVEDIGRREIKFDLPLLIACRLSNVAFIGVYKAFSKNEVTIRMEQYYNGLYQQGYRFNIRAKHFAELQDVLNKYNK